MRFKIVLFTNENFFWNFKNVLLKLSYEIYFKKQHDLLTDRIEQKKIFFSPKWFSIMKLMFSNMYIPDFSEIKDLDVIKEENINHIINSLSTYEIDKLQFLYLKKMCITKLKKLNFLSLKLKIPLMNIFQIYLDLCIKEIINNRKKKQNYISNNNVELLNNEYNGINNLNNINRKTSFLHLGSRRKSLRMSGYLFNSIIKENSSYSKINKSRKIIDENDISNTIDLFSKRGNSHKNKFLFSKSFTRLFIGGTDKDSILRRHLSNVLVFKQANSYKSRISMDLSGIYLKKFFNKLYKKNCRELLIDKVLKSLFDKLKKNQKFVEDFNKRSNSNSIKKILVQRFSTIDSELNISNYYNKTKLPFNSDLDNIDKNEVEEQILKTFNYNNNKKNKTNFKIERRIKSAKVRNKYSLKDKSPKKNNESILIENIFKDLSKSKCFSKKLNNKNNLRIKTTFNNQLKSNNNNYIRNNYYNNFRTSSLRKYNNYKKSNIKDLLQKNDFFYD